MSDFDSSWKDALRRLFQPFMAFFAPEAYDAIDWGRPYETLDKELQQITADAKVGLFRSRRRSRGLAPKSRQVDV
jgi:hypothetical protein